MSEGTDRLKSGRRKMNHARYLVQVEGASDEADARAREGLATLRSAMNWLEGTAEFEEAHAVLDEEGRFTRETFGCALEQEEDGYWVTCPVALAHNRVGMSIGAIVREARCSICLQDPHDCEHIIGEQYDGDRCVRMIIKADLLEVSFVTRPADPDARIHRLSVSTKELRARLGPNWQPGMRVSCDRCLTPCDGLSYPELVH